MAFVLIYGASKCMLCAAHVLIYGKCSDLTNLLVRATLAIKNAFAQQGLDTLDAQNVIPVILLAGISSSTVSLVACA